MTPTGPLAVAERLRRQLKERTPVFGAWISIGHPEIASLFAGAKGDFIGFDLEHTTIDFPTAQQIIRACHEFGRACLPRISSRDHFEQMRRLLDAGADGVVVPQVSSREEVDRIVEALRYPPQGTRSFGVAAAHRYGRAFEAYVRSANASLSLIVQVETKAAVERIQSIVAHPDVDGVMVGPYDLSGSLGIPGKLSDPRVTKAARRVVAACASTGKSCGMHLVRPTLGGIRRHLADGFTFLVLGSDVFNLAQRSEELDAMIEACHADH